MTSNMGGYSLSNVFDVDKRLYDKITDIAFAAKVHFLKKIVTEETTGNFTVEPSNNLFLLYCAANNINWVFEASIRQEGEFLAIKKMHHGRILSWYADTFEIILKEIRDILFEWTDSGKVLTSFAPATTAMINDMLNSRISSMMDIMSAGVYGDANEYELQRHMSDIDMVDTILLHELYQIDAMGKDKHRVNKSAGMLVDRRKLRQLLMNTATHITLNTSRNSKSIRREYMLTTQHVLTIYSLISKLYTHTHIRALDVPSSENTTYKQLLHSVMCAVANKLYSSDKSHHHGAQCALREAICKLKEYKCLLSTHPVLRTMIPSEAIVFGYSKHVPYLNTVRDADFYSITELNKTLDIVLNSSSDFYMLFSLLHSSLMDSSNLS